MSTADPPTVVKAGVRIREYFVERKAFWKRIRWTEVVRTETLGHEIHIYSPSKVDKLYFNGKELEL